jgi:5'(3')-deoxyribonucleotidase
MIKRSKTIVVCDIDGCLNYYPQCFVDWVNARFDLNLPNLERVKVMLGSSYEGVKSAYRTCGVKRNQKVVPGAGKVLMDLRSRGYQIHLVTTRPELTAVVEDTKYWLLKNDIQHDRLVFTEDKVGYVSQHLDQINLVFEDDPGTAESMRRMGVEVFIVDNSQPDPWSQISEALC